jgi:hypothetical protein
MGETGMFKIGGKHQNRTSIKDRIKAWYINPLLKMKKDDCFICLSICFLLYEKYLTSKYGNDNFSDGQECFKEMGRTFKISSDESYEFWQTFRNGLLHRAMPKLNGKVLYKLVSDQVDPIKRTGIHVSVNPWKIRDIITELLLKKQALDMWRDDDYPLLFDYK